MVTNQQNRNDYSIAASQSAQANFETVAATLEAALDRRDRDVRDAMTRYQADGVSDQYAAMEAKWKASGDEVREIIRAVRNSLQQNDDIAERSLTRAASYIP